MSKQLFEFVKVAAGEPVDVGSLVCYMQPDVRAMVRELSFGPGGKAPHDFWFLRPAESPDAGREGFIEKVRNFVDNNWNPAAVADFMRSHWPTPADPQPVSKEREGMNMEQMAAKDYAKLIYPDIMGIDGSGPYIPELQRDVAERVYLDLMDKKIAKEVLQSVAASFSNRQEQPQEKTLPVLYKMFGKENVFFTASTPSEGVPTPADPGSQVEAVDPAKLLEWVRKNGFFPDIDNEWTKYNHGTRSYEVFKDADLITLYKQSL